MIKRLWFLDSADPEAAAWVDVALSAPPEVRPIRLVTCIVLDPEMNDSPHGRIDMAWFADAAHLARFDEAHALGALSGSGGSSGRGIGGVCSLAADELVLRGDDWLTGRWHEGGTRLKHIAMAARSPGLTSEEFSERWKAHAGTAGATPIPERARGLAYAQNHPLLPQPSSEGGQGFGYRICAYDAVNEVWFDDPERLRERVRWLAENLPDEGEDRLFGARHSIAVEETVLLG